MAQVIRGQIPGSVEHFVKTPDAPSDFRFGVNSGRIAKVFKTQRIVECYEIAKADGVFVDQSVQFLRKRSLNANASRSEHKVGCRSGKEVLRIAALQSTCGGVGASSLFGAFTRRGGLSGRLSNHSEVAGQFQLSSRRRVNKMATMALPRAVMEDSNGENAAPRFNGEYAAVPGDVESQQTEYGTFGASDRAKDIEDTSRTEVEPSSTYMKWDATTARLADSATAAFLLLQLPQIILNTENLIAGKYAALFAVPWMGQLTALLGNLSLLSYFASKRERGAMVVQAVGVVSTLIVLSQLAVAGAMPPLAFAATATAVFVGLLVNFLNYVNKLSSAVWRLWGEVVSIAGLTVLPQVMWSTFEPYIPHSLVPGTFFGILAVTMIALARLEKLPPKVRSIMGGVSAWTATLLFMWAPVAQWWTNYINPANIRGLSIFTILLAMVGNSLLLPRALFTRDLMWFTGSSWGTMLQGWGILLSMYMGQVITDVIFWGVSAVLALWLGLMLWNDSKAYKLDSPLKPLVELISGSRRP